MSEVLKFCIVYDIKHTQGFEENISEVFFSIEEVKDELSSLENSENIRVYELKPTLERI